MKYSALRHYIKNTNMQKCDTLKDCDLVIDGHSYFKNDYRESGCQFIVGPECDRYANYLMEKLSVFQKYNIKCYVIFKGSTKQNIEKRQERHQTIINQRRNVDNNLDNSTYFEPLFVRDVLQYVLDVLNIKYFCCEYDSMEAVVGVAKAFKCPVITNNLEYCLFGISCILPKDIIHQVSDKTLQCKIYEHDKLKSFFGLYDKIPVLLTILNESIDFSDVIPEWCQCIYNCDIRSIIRWIKKQGRQRSQIIAKISKMFVDENKTKLLMDWYNKIEILYDYPTFNLAVKYFRRRTPYGLFKDDKKWFSKGVSTGRIAVPYIDIKKHGLIIGSTGIYDENKPDALHAAIPIIAFSHCVLTNSQKSTLNFIGRNNTSSTISKINICFEKEIRNIPIFNLYRKSKYRDIENPFSLFVSEIITGRDSKNLFTKLLPISNIILHLSLVYYIKKVNKSFIDGVYFVFLSYHIIGHVRKKLQILKENEVSFTYDYKDYKRMDDELKFLFNKVEIKDEYNIDFIHSLAEFQHCLQYINYLNKLCGSPMTCTNYASTYNATFIFNAYLFFKNKTNLMQYLESNFENSISLKAYKDLINDFKMSLTIK